MMPKDLSEHKASLQYLKELALKIEETEKIKRAWIEDCSDGVWDWNLNRDYEYMSPRFWEIFGYEPHEKEHHPSAWQNIIFAEDKEKALKIFKEHVESKGKVPYKMIVRYKHKNGHTVKVICRGEVIEWNEDGSPARMIGIHTDVTNMKE